MSQSVIGQSDIKWLKRAGKMTDPCATPAPSDGKVKYDLGGDKIPYYSEGMPQAIWAGCVGVGSGGSSQ